MNLEDSSKLPNEFSRAFVVVGRLGDGGQGPIKSKHPCLVVRRGVRMGDPPKMVVFLLVYLEYKGTLQKQKHNRYTSRLASNCGVG